LSKEDTLKTNETLIEFAQTKECENPSKKALLRDIVVVVDILAAPGDSTRAGSASTARGLGVVGSWQASVRWHVCASNEMMGHTTDGGGATPHGGERRETTSETVSICLVREGEEGGEGDNKEGDEESKSHVGRAGEDGLSLGSRRGQGEFL
jgi:hypothetical protein